MENRLTLNLGVLYANDDASVPEACRDAAMFAPAQCWDKIQLRVFNSIARLYHPPDAHNSKLIFTCCVLQNRFVKCFFGKPAN